MPSIDLQVPYSQKDEAKSLGAKWDRENKVWFIPDGIDPTPLTGYCGACPSDGQFYEREHEALAPVLEKENTNDGIVSIPPDPIPQGILARVSSFFK